MKKLAIVIPAYKNDFLERTLESIAAQTNKDFTLYIGDDNSPHTLESIVERFKDRIDLHYHRFEENVGGKDLVAQWERCINLTRGEEWIWLFSDDDLMSEDAVDSVMKGISKASPEDLLHLNVDVIDEEEKTINRIRYPHHLSNDEYYLDTLKGKYESFVVEFIFHRANFFNKGRFQKFDLAWGSDFITWLKLSKERGITTLPSGKVLWRWSGINITSNKERRIFIRKYKAAVKNYLFYLKFYKRKHLWRTLRSFAGMTYGDLRQITKAKS